MLDSNQRPRGCEPRALTTEPIAPRVRSLTRRDGPGSYIETRPSRPDRRRLEAIDLDQLPAARCPGDQVDVGPGQAERIGKQLRQCRVGRTVDRRRSDPRSEHAIDHRLDPVGAATRREANGESSHGHRRSLAGGRARSEDRAADANERRALLDGNRIVLAHAHRERRPESRVVGAQSLRQLAKRTERGTCQLRRRDEPANRHQAADHDARQLEDRRELVLQHARLEARLRPVLIDVHLQQHRQRPARPHLQRDPAQRARRAPGNRPSRSRRTARWHDAPCSTGAGRPGATTLARPRSRRPSPRAPGRGSHRTCRTRRRRRPGSAPAPRSCETATTSTSAGRAARAGRSVGDPLEDRIANGSQVIGRGHVAILRFPDCQMSPTAARGTFAGHGSAKNAALIPRRERAQARLRGRKGPDRGPLSRHVLRGATSGRKRGQPRARRAADNAARRQDRP